MTIRDVILELIKTNQNLDQQCVVKILEWRAVQNPKVENTVVRNVNMDGEIVLEKQDIVTVVK